MEIPHRYRRVLPERAMKGVVGSRPDVERLGKMPVMPRVPTTPFAQTRQTLPVLLDRRGPPDDAQVGVAECADSFGTRR